MSVQDRTATARPTGRLVGYATGLLERTLDRRNLLTRMSLVGAAVATSGMDFVLRPGSAYASVCGSGSSCGSGWTAMCCTIHEGVNRCPPGTFAGGWWKAAGASLCGGKARYYVDCQAKCTKCGCGRGHFCARKCANCKSKCAHGSCDKRKTCHNMFRYGQCNRDIACSGPIACRAISCTPPWKWADCSTASATDNYTRSHAASCLPKWSSIMKRYTAMGSQASVLGATVKKEYDGHRGRIQRYQRGRMYWTKSTGAHWLDKELLARYVDLGQSSSPLGMPIEDPVTVKTGRGAHFQKGGIYQAQGGRAYALWGVIWDVWVRNDTYAGPLGYPITDRVVTPDTQGSGARFQHGIILNGPDTATCAVHGLAAVKYASLHYERSPLGYPAKEQRHIVDVDAGAWFETLFEHGTVTHDGTTPYAVWGRVHQAWRENGGPTGTFGSPTSDVVQLDAGHQRGTFRHGTITYDAATDQITYTYGP